MTQPRVPSPHQADPTPGVGEDGAQWTDRLARQGAALGVKRQCSIGWHVECSNADDGPDAECRCLCHDIRDRLVLIRSGAEQIMAERWRQVTEEAYDDEHDARQTDESLARAAACYALPAKLRRQTMRSDGPVPDGWPWHASYWKPHHDDRIRELVKAGALIAAEIDRLQAIEAQS